MPVQQNTTRKGISFTWDEVFDPEAPADSSFPEQVTVFATGEDGDVHNKLPQPNNGEAGVFYPVDFVGTSDVEIRADDGTVVSSGTLSVD